jgi:hypothetical protein
MNKTLDFTASSAGERKKNDQLQFFSALTRLFGAGKNRKNFISTCGKNHSHTQIISQLSCHSTNLNFFSAHTQPLGTV